MMSTSCIPAEMAANAARCMENLMPWMYPAQGPLGVSARRLCAAGCKRTLDFANPWVTTLTMCDKVRRPNRYSLRGYTIELRRVHGTAKVYA
jgi:hypothetical protein